MEKNEENVTTFSFSLTLSHYLYFMLVQIKREFMTSIFVHKRKATLSFSIVALSSRGQVKCSLLVFF